MSIENARKDATTCNRYDDAVNILLVEDQKSDVMLIQRALRKGGIVNPIYVVRDGEQALAYLMGEGKYADRQTYPLPSMMLLDLKMPKVGGLEVLRQVKQTEGLKRILIIVLTSSALSADVDKAYDLGANSYLVKPVKTEDFIKVASDIKCYWLMMNQKPTVVEV